MAEELCKADAYNAFQISGRVVVTATCKHKTAGYIVRFRDTPIAVFPPEYELVHTAPSDPTAQVETLFVAYTSFPATDKVARVVVHDASGRRDIKVEQTDDVTQILQYLLPGNPSTTPD